MIWRPFSASVKVNHRRFYSRILVKVSLVVMAATLVKRRLKKMVFVYFRKKDPVLIISRNLAKKWFRNHVNDLSRKV